MHRDVEWFAGAQRCRPPVSADVGQEKMMMKRFLTLGGVMAIAAIVAVGLIGCASTRIEHVSGSEFMNHARNTACPGSFVWDSYIGSVSHRAYLEYGHPAFIGKGLQVTVLWTDLSELPSNIVAQIEVGVQPWTNGMERIGQPAGGSHVSPATGDPFAHP